MKYIVETGKKVSAEMERALFGTVRSFGMTIFPMTEGDRDFERYLRVEDIARITGLSRSTIYRGVHEGKLKGIKTGTSNRAPILFTQEEFTKWISGGIDND